MPCNGNNHGPDCNCGWGGVFYPAIDRLFEQALVHWSQKESYTVPNARCPVCKASVFFYAASNGGRVFFDELGPPWPKHPCTDRSGGAGLRTPPRPIGNRPSVPIKKGWWHIDVTDITCHPTDTNVTVMTVGDPSDPKYLYCWDPDALLRVPGPRLLTNRDSKEGPTQRQYTVSALVETGGQVVNRDFAAFGEIEQLRVFRKAVKQKKQQKKQQKKAAANGSNNVCTDKGLKELEQAYRQFRQQQSSSSTDKKAA